MNLPYIGHIICNILSTLYDICRTVYGVQCTAYTIPSTARIYIVKLNVYSISAIILDNVHIKW